MPVLALLALLPAVPLQEWTALELPAAALERGTRPSFRALYDGRHVRFEPELDAPPPSESALLPGLRAAQLLEGEARRGGRALEVFQGAPPLVVRADAATIDWANSVLAEVDAAAARARIEVRALLAPIAGSGAAGDVTAPAPEQAPAGSSSWSAGLRSGDTVALGERHRQSFVGSFDVEVASDSGVAAPMLGRVEYGETLHLRACRLEGGRRVALEGLLDIAELVAVEPFDPGGPDLGIVEQPIVRFAQVAFSDGVEAGGVGCVELYGLPLARPDWTLWLQVATTEEPLDARPDAWRLADLALLSEAARSLPPFPLGSELAYAEPGAIGGEAKAMSPSGLVALVESALRQGVRGSGSVGWPTERFVLLPASEVDVWRALGELTSALESGRARSAGLELRQGDLLVRAPIANENALRVAVGTERTWLVDYSSQIAPDVWMPSPIVERGFDGLVFQARSEAGRLSASTTIARTLETRALDRERAYLGALQLPARSARGARSELAGGVANHTLLQASGDEPAVTLSLQRP